MARIAIGGMQHETNTFAPSKADYPAFEAGGGWPGVQFGDSLLEETAKGIAPAAAGAHVRIITPLSSLGRGAGGEG